MDELSERLTENPVKYALLSYYERKFDVRFKFFWGKKEFRGKMIDTTLQRKPKPPYDLKVFKGFKNVILRRDFVEFSIQHPVAKKFQKFLKDTRIPDEHYYATLSRIEKVETIELENG